MKMTRLPVDLRGALAAVLAGSDVPRYVRDEIAASWRRSAASGLRPEQVDVAFDPDFDGDGLLVQAARPVLNQLAVDLAGTPVGVVLADAGGHVVDRSVASDSLRTLLDRILLAPGFIHSEASVGTNGIGTALAQRRPVAVEGDEHFADLLTPLACAGAPICDPRDGHVLGVIALTSLTGDRSALMLPMATRAAREIVQRVVDASGVSERLMLQRFLQERRRVKGPLVFLTQHTMITNAAADRLVSGGDEVVLREHAQRMLDDGADSDVELGRGTISVASEALSDGGTRVGTMLLLKPVGVPIAHHAPQAFGWESLTSTERSVIELVADGLTNRETAERLFMSRHTVDFHLRSIFCKLGVNSRVELTRLAIENDANREEASVSLVAVAGRM
jgi:DNA-binding CsgD family transcriptional regulator